MLAAVSSESSTERNGKHMAHSRSCEDRDRECQGLSISNLPAWCATRLTTTAATTAKTTTTTAARRTAIRPRTCFVDVHGSSSKLPAVQSGDCFFGFGVVGHLNKSKASGLTGLAIGHNTDTFNGSVSFKKGTDRVFGRSEAEVSYKNVLHCLLVSLLI